MDTAVKRYLVIAAVICAVTLLAYSNTFHASFHFDDEHQVVKNTNVHVIENLPSFFTTAGMGSYTASGNRGYRPVTYASFALNYAVSGLDTWSYHVLNLLIHLINVLLVYLVAMAVLDAAGGRDGKAAALSGALLFALHPIQTSAVTYISGRAALLATSFTLAAFYAFTRFRAGGVRRYIWAGAVPVLFILGLLSKEMAVSFLGLALLYDLLFTLPKTGGMRPMRGAAVFYVPVVAALMLYLVIKGAVQGVYTVPYSPYGVWEYMVSEAKTLLMYVRLIVLPINQNADYNVPVTESLDAFAAVSMVLVSSAAILLYRVRRKSPAVAFFGFWFLISIAPESSIFPVEDIAVEYRLYMPSAGFIMALVVIMHGLLKDRRFVRAAAFSTVALLMALTFTRNAVWATDESLWRDAARKAPGSARAHTNLGHALLIDKRYQDAVDELSRSLTYTGLTPKALGVTYNELGVCYTELGLPDKAIAAYREAVETYPEMVEPYFNIGKAYERQGRYAEAEEVLVKAAGINPDYLLNRLELAVVYSAMGRHNDAVFQMEEAARLAPGDPDVRYRLELAYSNAGRPVNSAIQEVR